MSATIIPTRRSWLSRLWRDLHARYLRWCERCVLEERQHYVDAGIAGPNYLRNSTAQAEILRVRIADLENS